MTPYTAYELTSGRATDFNGGLFGLTDSLDSAGLGDAESRLLSALFDADGASPAALGARLAAAPPVVEAALGTLARRGLVETTESGAWLTGEAFGLRRAVRRAGERASAPSRAS
ncbi:MAG TPA: hypothetical protein VF594_11210 [Rubricoccaceae bacterium]|jgi:hypothetical protein